VARKRSVQSVSKDYSRTYPSGRGSHPGIPLRTRPEWSHSGGLGGSEPGRRTALWPAVTGSRLDQVRLQY